jgi:hypothetical protein
MNQHQWMPVDTFAMNQPTTSGLANINGKLVMMPGNPGMNVASSNVNASSFGSSVPSDLGQFGGSDQCRNPACKCNVFKPKSTYGYARQVRRSHGLPTSISKRMCEFGNYHVDSRFTKPLSVDTGTEYELPKHLYPPPRSDPILMIHPSYKRYLGIKQRLPGNNQPSTPLPMTPATSTNFQWSDQVKRCGSAQRQCVNTSSGPSASTTNTFAVNVPQYVPKSQQQQLQLPGSHLRQSSLPVSIDVTRPTYSRQQNVITVPGHYRAASTDQASFASSCADLGIPVSEHQQQPQFKVLLIPNIKKIDSNVK